MAAFVCYRFCCRQLQHVSKSFSVVRHSWQIIQPELLIKQVARPVPVSSWWMFYQNARHYHGLGGRQRGDCQQVFSCLRTVLWRSFRSQTKGRDHIRSIGGASDHQGLLRPFVFTVFVCGSSFIGCMLWQYETLRRRAQDVMKGLDRQFNKVFEPSYQKEMGFRAHMNAMWNNMSDGQKMVLGIIGLNFLVFIAWKFPTYQPFLLRYFSSIPGNPTVSMVLSAFSHYNLWHIIANMYVLWSFANISVSIFGREQWLAVYLSAASISSLASVANKVIRYKAATVAPSLGASGAIMCLLGAVCVKYPDAQLSIAFVGEIFPHSFSASSALKVILLLDTAGLVLGWRMFDHAAHLGGVLFGLWYVTYGHKLIWGKREKVMEWWHTIRGKSSK